MNQKKKNKYYINIKWNKKIVLIIYCKSSPFFFIEYANVYKGLDYYS